MHSTQWAFLGLFALVATTIAGQLASAQEDDGRRPEALSPELAQQLGRLLERDWQERPEWALMMSDLLQGRGMRLGEGWFRVSESRYSWPWLVKRFDADGDGRIRPTELPDSKYRQLFWERLDRDGNGLLSEADFSASRSGTEVNLAGRLFSKLDTDSNGRVSPDEMNAFFAAADQEGQGFLTRDDLEQAFATGRGGSRGGAAFRPSPTDLLAMLLKGEFGSLGSGPDLNDAAPDFELKTFDGKRSIALSSFRDQKPVVLVFGSFT